MMNMQDLLKNERNKIQTCRHTCVSECVLSFTLDVAVSKLSVYCCYFSIKVSRSEKSIISGSDNGFKLGERTWMCLI